MGHFDLFPAISPSVDYLFGQETVAGATPDGRSAPKPVNNPNDSFRSVRPLPDLSRNLR
jgi:hypothetical protein